MSILSMKKCRQYISMHPASLVCVSARKSNSLTNKINNLSLYNLFGLLIGLHNCRAIPSAKFSHRYQSNIMAEPRTSKSDGPIQNWTKEEKYHLMQAIKAFGRHDINKIQEYVSSKNVEETRAAVNYFTQIALQHPMFVQKQQDTKSKASKRPQVPLASWAKLLTDSLQYSELRTETATAVRMIADLEDIPSAVCTDNIDFRQVYHQIANAMEGKPLSLDLATAAVLHKCLTETALSSKAFIKTAAYKYIINTIDLSDREINTFPRPTENHELAILRHLAAQRSYNPLKIPEDYLKPSCENVLKDPIYD